MIQTALRREERENPYAGLPLPDTVREQTRQVSGLLDLINEFEEILEDKDEGRMQENMIKEYVRTPTIILSPEDIDHFLQTTKIFDDHRYYEYDIGIFISRLIQSSYEAGHNDFCLNTDYLNDLGNIGAGLRGKDETPIKISIKGDVKYTCGAYAENCEFNITGNTGQWLGDGSNRCVFNIDGNIDIFGGTAAKNCKFISKDNASYDNLKNFAYNNNTIFLTDSSGHILDFVKK